MAGRNSPTKKPNGKKDDSEKGQKKTPEQQQIPKSAVGKSAKKEQHKTGQKVPEKQQFAPGRKMLFSEPSPQIMHSGAIDDNESLGVSEEPPGKGPLFLIDTPPESTESTPPESTEPTPPGTVSTNDTAEIQSGPRMRRHKTDIENVPVKPEFAPGRKMLYSEPSPQIAHSDEVDDVGSLGVGQESNVQSSKQPSNQIDWGGPGTAASPQFGPWWMPVPFHVQIEEENKLKAHKKAVPHQKNVDVPTTSGSTWQPIAGPPVIVMPAEHRRPVNALKPNHTYAEYRVISMLGTGGFGQVYKALDTKGTECAVKVQDHMRPALKEQEVLTAFHESQVAKSWKTRHYPIFHKLVKWENNQDMPPWIVIELLGKTLFRIQSRCRKPMIHEKRLSIPTVYGVMVQCIQAVQQLHEVGFIHRDLSPDNFAVGNKPPDDRVIYVFDFGLCRRYRDDNGHIIPTEPSVKNFLGTPMYCSTAAHLKQQQYRRDDFKCLIHVFWEMIIGDLSLRWTNKDTPFTLDQKQRLFPSFRDSMPNEVQTFFGYIEKLEPDDRPPYEDMCERFRDLIQNNTVRKVRDERQIEYEWLRGEIGCHGLTHFELALPPGASGSSTYSSSMGVL